MNQFSLDDLRAVLGAVPPEPVAPDRAAAVRRRVRQVRQRRSAVGAVALAVPALSLGVLRGDGDGEEPLFPGHTSTAAAPSRQPTPGHQSSPPTAARSASVAPRTDVPGGGLPNRPRKGSPGRPGSGRPGPGLVVTLTPSATEVQVGDEVTFAVQWSDTDGHYKGYEMSYGDIGASAFKKVFCDGRDVHPEAGQQHFSHAWTEPGTYRVYFSVLTGDCGAADETVTGAVDVVVHPAPPPSSDEPSPAPSAQPTESAAPVATTA
jgi:hypothetical protein